MKHIELLHVRDTFLEELKLSAQGRKTSLPFIRHQLAPKPLISEGVPFQALVIGGSIYQSALLKKDASGVQILERKQGSLPELASKEVFLSFVDSMLYPDIPVLALNFAYALYPALRDNRLDGQLVWGSKEHLFTGLVGESVGEEIEKHFAVSGRLIQVAIANDAICMLLAGRFAYHSNSIACGIVGTGLNFAMYLDERTAVNLESGEFDKLDLSAAGAELDATSSSPGSAIIEKETAGAYLYQLYNIQMQTKAPGTEPVHSTEQLDGIARDVANAGSAVAREILDRSAALVAAQISGILEFHGHDLTFSMAGSLFWKGDGYKQLVEAYVKQLSIDYQASYVLVEDSEIMGAAGLVT